MPEPSGVRPGGVPGSGSARGPTWGSLWVRVSVGSDLGEPWGQGQRGVRPGGALGSGSAQCSLSWSGSQSRAAAPGLPGAGPRGSSGPPGAWAALAPPRCLQVLGLPSPPCHITASREGPAGPGRRLPLREPPGAPAGDPAGWSRGGWPGGEGCGEQGCSYGQPVHPPLHLGSQPCQLAQSLLLT